MTTLEWAFWSMLICIVGPLVVAALFHFVWVRLGAQVNLTAAQRKRLAREARKLAMECLTNGPEMTDGWCGCAIGISLARAGLLPSDHMEQHYLGCQLEALVDPIGQQGVYGILSAATRERLFRRNPTAVVFPLLALATALDGKVL